MTKRAGMSPGQCGESGFQSCISFRDRRSCGPSSPAIAAASESGGHGSISKNETQMTFSIVGLADAYSSSSQRASANAGSRSPARYFASKPPRNVRHEQMRQSLVAVLTMLGQECRYSDVNGESVTEGRVGLIDKHLESDGPGYSGAARWWLCGLLWHFGSVSVPVQPELSAVEFDQRHLGFE